MLDQVAERERVGDVPLDPERQRLDPGDEHGLDRVRHSGPARPLLDCPGQTIRPVWKNELGGATFEVGEGPVILNACQIDVDPATGRALAIERIQRLVEVG